MWGPSNVVEKEFNVETHRLIGEIQLHEFGVFLDKFNEDITKQQRKFTNSQNVTYQPILLDSNIYTNESILHLVHSDDKILSRILASLSGMCQEVQLLVKEAESLYPDLIWYGESADANFEQISIGKIVETLQKVNSFVERIQQVSMLCLNQLCAIIGKGMYTPSNTSTFPEIFSHFGDLLICLLKLDKLLESQVLRDNWFLYRKTVKNVSHNYTKYEFTQDQITSLDKTLLLLEKNLLSNGILKVLIEKFLEDKNFYYQIKSCSLNTEIIFYLGYLLNELEKDVDYFSFSENTLKLNTVLVFYLSIFGNTDKKLLKRVLEINKKACALNLVGNILWYPETFLLKHVPSFVAKIIDKKAVESSRLSSIQNRNLYLQKETNYICLQACYLLIELKKTTKLDTSNLKVKDLEMVEIFLTNVLKVCRKINFLVKWTLNVHADKDLPLNKTVLLNICKLTEVLKCFQLLFTKELKRLIYVNLLIHQHLSRKALVILNNIRKQFTREKSYKERQLDVLSALKICERALKGPSTKESILVANLALSASELSSSDIFELKFALNRLESMINFVQSLEIACDCSFLFGHQNYVLQIYFSNLISSKTDISRYYLILTAINDCFRLNDKESESVKLLMKEKFLTPLNQIIETNIRLQTHLHLQLTQKDPFNNYLSLNFNKYQPVNIINNYSSLKNEAEHYLSTMFYNLTTVVLHDWKTYGEMRRLALLQYGLETVDDNLPIQTLEQGLDVLEIMRNINVFVSKYLYNLNSQIFIEANSNNKHLNSIGISHVANSIRTHGIGILNTTVNFTYQFLRNKFHIFSQFMFDEHIKSRLLKDLRFFAENKTSLNQMYPYERAEKFNVGIRKLGVNQNGESFLDLFRKVITHIGNAMGYVRLIKSGGRRCLADGTCFIPDLKKIHLLQEVVDEEENMPELSKRTVDCLSRDLQTFLDNIEEATEYFKLLVKVFVPVLRNKNNIHLKNFYVIFPPLTINYVEHSINSKEKLHKRNNDCSFTDDGFALGLAYIIELLDQESKLNSLHWFQSVQRKFKNDRLKFKETTAAKNEDSKLNQALSLTEKRISTFEREFQLLYFNLYSARRCFQM